MPDMREETPVQDGLITFIVTAFVLALLIGLLG